MLQGRLKAEGKKLGSVNITERSGAIRQKKQHQSVGLRESAMGVFRILSESALHEAWG